MKLETLPFAQRYAGPPVDSGTVINFLSRMRISNRPALMPGQSAEIIDLTVYRLLKAHRGPRPSGRL